MSESRKTYRFDVRKTPSGATATMVTPRGHTVHKRFRNGYMSAETSARVWIGEQVEICRECALVDGRDSAEFVFGVGANPLGRSAHRVQPLENLHSVRSGQIYRHFKGDHYLVLHVVQYADRDDGCGVVYCRLDIPKDSKVYCRSMDNFLSQTDCGQERFSLVCLEDTRKVE